MIKREFYELQSDIQKSLHIVLPLKKIWKHPSWKNVNKDLSDHISQAAPPPPKKKKEEEENSYINTQTKSHSSTHTFLWLSK